jgi:hypothetical protein
MARTLGVTFAILDGQQGKQGSRQQLRRCNQLFFVKRASARPHDHSFGAFSIKIRPANAGSGHQRIAIHEWRRIDMRSTVRQANDEGVRAVIHAASLHKPHVATHNYQDFIDTNVTGTLILLEEAAAAGTFAQYDQTLTSTPLSFDLDQVDRAPSGAGHCIQSGFAADVPRPRT